MSEGRCFICGKPSRYCHCNDPVPMQGYSDGAAMRAVDTRAYYIVEIRPEQWGDLIARLERIEQKVDAQEPFHTAQALIRSGKEVSHAVLDHLLVSLASDDEAVRVWAQNSLNGYVQLRKQQEEENK